MADDEVRPIIIKRKKVIAGGHHGGAWKVAYADFVTAMMAFFLLMWLLGATNENQRKGIADYFNPTIPVNRVSGGGDGAFGGDSIFSEQSLSENGTGAGLVARAEADTEGDKSAEDKELEEVADALLGKGGESYVSDLLKRHIVTRVTDEGLIVEIFDIPGLPLFTKEDAATTTLKEALTAISEVFQLSPNRIAVQGYVASLPLVRVEQPVWTRSALRANEVRRLLVRSGLPESRMKRVTGFADGVPVVADPLASRNNRIEIILLRDRL